MRLHPPNLLPRGGEALQAVHLFLPFLPFPFNTHLTHAQLDKVVAEELEGILNSIIIMSSAEHGDYDEVCASCGWAREDVQTRECNFCRYQEEKNERRMAEIRDDPLFTPPPEISHLGECPICCLPLPLDMGKYRLNTCCCKLICIGCSHADEKREREQDLEHKCPYCRSHAPDTQEEGVQMMMPRVEANDPVALGQMGVRFSLEGDYDGAFEYLTKAAELGDAEAHYQLSVLYDLGEGVEKDMKKAVHHWERAAISGHATARYNLGCIEDKAHCFHRASQHWVIAAKLGHDDSLKKVKNAYQYGLASKDDFAAALRGHQAAVDATKSQQRTEAEAFYAIFNAGN